MPHDSARLQTKPRFLRGDPQPSGPATPPPSSPLPPPSPQDRPSHSAWAWVAPLHEAEPREVGPAGGASHGETQPLPRSRSKVPPPRPMVIAAESPLSLPAVTSGFGYFRLPARGRAASGGAGMAGAARPGPTCLLLGATGVGKSLLGKRLRNIRASWGSWGAGPGWGRVARCFWPVLNAPAQLCSRDGAKELGEPPATLPTVGTNLTDLTLHKRVTLRELGGCMGPIWPSYYGECSAVLVSARPAALQGGTAPLEPPQASLPSLQFVIDAANPTQVSASCVQLLSLLSAEQLATVPVLILFNKM